MIQVIIVGHNINVIFQVEILILKRSEKDI